MKTLIIGAGGHARVVYDILKHDRNNEIEAFVDNVKRGSNEEIMGVPVVGDHSVIDSLIDGGVKGFIIAIGDNEIRRKYFEILREKDLIPVNAIHPESHLSSTVDAGNGIVVAEGVSVSTNASLGDNVIVNTGSIVEHETDISDHTHVGPGNTLAGRVEVGSNVFVGMGCSVKEHTSIGDDAVIGAGSVVLDDVPPNTVVAGTPAEVKKENDDAPSGG